MRLLTAATRGVALGTRGVLNPTCYDPTRCPCAQKEKTPAPCFWDVHLCTIFHFKHRCGMWAVRKYPRCKSALIDCNCSWSVAVAVVFNWLISWFQLYFRHFVIISLSLLILDGRAIYKCEIFYFNSWTNNRLWKMSVGCDDRYRKSSAFGIFKVKSLSEKDGRYVCSVSLFLPFKNRINDQTVISARLYSC